METSSNTAQIIAQQQQQNALLETRVAELEHQLDWFKRQLFGRKSEKQIIDNPQQGGLFDSAPIPPSSPPATTEVKSHQRKSNKQRSDENVNDTGLRFEESVPQQIIDLAAPELEGENADQYEVIDYKETCRLAQQPGSYVVLRYRRPVLRHKALQTLTTSPAPANVLEGCYVDVSLLAGLMVDKAVYHLPLYRQHQRMLDSGITVSRASLTNWIMKAIELLRPIYRAMYKHILLSKVLAMDEVPIKAGRKAKGKMKQTYYWPIYGEDDEVAFTWSSGRGMRHAKEQLKDFKGILLTDGYPTYERTVAALNKHELKVEHASCWVHNRRYYEKALKAEPEAAQQALDIIATLYRHEREIRDKQLDADTIMEYRQQHCEPLVQEFFKFVYSQRQNPGLLPKNPLSKALFYSSEREAQLKVFLANPNVPMDTNHLERALRVIPMGRKNYLFCWSELGAEQLGILQSLMVTCRLHDINPYTYLVDVLQRVSLHPAKDVLDLTPRLWKERFALAPLKSDVSPLHSKEHQNGY